MSGTSTIDARRMGVTAATSLLTGLGEVVVRVGNDQLGPFLREVDDLSRQIDAARVAILAEALSRGVVAGSDCATAAGWVIRWAPSFRAGGAGQLVKVAHATRSVRKLALAAAVLGARVSVRNAAVALVEMDKLRPRLRDEAVEAVWAGFVQIAMDHGPGEIRGLRDTLIATHGHRGDFQRRADQLKHGVSLSQPLDDDGMAEYRLRLDPEGKEVLEAMLGPLAAPNPTPDCPDLRTSDQRRGDALVAICRRAAAAGGEAPTTTKAALWVTMDLDGLRNGCGAGSTLGGQLLGPETIRRIVRGLLVGLAAGLVAGIGFGSWFIAAADTPSTPTAQKQSATPAATSTTPSPPPRPTTAAMAPLTLTASGPGRLTSGSRPSVLPGPILIADERNHRLMIIGPRGRTMWQFPRPGDLAPGQTFKTPDDAFFTPDGRQIIVAQEDDNVIRVIDIATHKIVYTYGKPGVPGSGPNQLNHPDGSTMLPNGDILTPDINNCRIVLIPKGGHAISRQLGGTGTCVHSPPKTFGEPNGMFPMSNGNYLVTEAKGNWVDEMDLSGHVAWSAQLPSVSYIYESNEISPNRYVTIDHASRGQVLTFDRAGHVLWRYAPAGRQALNMPSLVLPLPNGDFLVDDKANHRIIVVDPRTNYVVWQYGHTHIAGSGPGYLNNPTGLDVYPPSSVLMK